MLQVVSDQVDDRVEQFIQSLALLGGHLEVLGVPVALRLELALLLGDLSVEVGLIPHEDLDGLVALVLLEHVVPGLEVGESGLLGDVVDHHCAVRVLHVVGDEAAEALLPRGVPQLDAVLLAVARYVFDVEVDAHGRLRDGKDTLSPSSKRSLMYFSMMEDLPTLWSPRKMILYLVRPPPTVEDDTLISDNKIPESDQGT